MCSSFGANCEIGDGVETHVNAQSDNTGCHYVCMALMVIDVELGLSTMIYLSRATFNVQGGKQPYTISEREQGFKATDNLASNDEVIRSGVEVAPIVELFVRSHDVISLEGCDSNSPIRKYIKKDAALQYITSNDIEGAFSQLQCDNIIGALAGQSRTAGLYERPKRDNVRTCRNSG